MVALIWACKMHVRRGWIHWPIAVRDPRSVSCLAIYYIQFVTQAPASNAKLGRNVVPPKHGKRTGRRMDLGERDVSAKAGHRQLGVDIARLHAQAPDNIDSLLCRATAPSTETR